MSASTIRDQERAEALEELIPVDLDMTTTARLVLVAKILRLHPEAHDQSVWCEGENQQDEWEPYVAQGNAAEFCGTRACVAGWAVMLTPHGTFSSYEDWPEAGRKALGLPRDLGLWLFDSTREWALLVDVLEHLAETIESDRTLGAVADFLAKHYAPTSPELVGR